MTNANNGFDAEPSLSSNSSNNIVALLGILGWTWKLCRGIIANYSKKGMYEVLDFQTTLILYDPKGKSATLTKYEKLRFLQDNIIAYQYQAWGDGKILQNYQCSPGIPVDFYCTGHKSYVLISLRDLKNKGDIAELNTRWKMKGCFLRPTGFWGTDISHCTDHIKVQVVFPKSRPPKKAVMVEINKQKEKNLGKGNRPSPR